MTGITSPLAALPETAATPHDVVIRLRDVVKEYPGDPPTRVLHGVDLTVRGGELLAIVGPSGSGKSTLLHIMGTLDRPTAGDVHIAGHDMARMSDKQLSALRSNEIGFVFQQFFLLPGMSAVENVADGLLYTGRRLRDRRARARATLERVGLGHRLDHNTEKLSGGERQRVAIARALVGEPSVVLADEPTGNLDSRSGDAIVELLHELHREGSTIVVITHDHEIAASLPRQVAVRDGLIELDSAAVDPIERRPDHPHPHPDPGDPRAPGPVRVDRPSDAPSADRVGGASDAPGVRQRVGGASDGPGVGRVGGASDAPGVMQRVDGDPGVPGAVRVGGDPRAPGAVRVDRASDVSGVGRVGGASDAPSVPGERRDPGGSSGRPGAFRGAAR